LRKILTRSGEGYAEVMRLNWVCIRRAQKARKQDKKNTSIGLRKRDEMIFESEKSIKKKRK